jgi:hypothetical protein
VSRPDPSGAAALNGTAAGAAAISLARGSATPEELAALVAVLTAAAGGGGDPAPPTRRSEWASRERAVRRPLTPGPGAWRASAWRP